VPAPRSEATPASLTVGEQRVLTVVLASADGQLATAQGTAIMPTIEQSGGTLNDLRAEVLRHGGNLERVVGGSLVATFLARGAATDQVAQAARCALHMRDALPSTRIAIATGRGQLANAWPVGEAIDRAAVLLRDAPPDAAGGARAIRLDDTTAGLLDGRFDVAGDARGLALFAERDEGDGSRTLLGRDIPCIGRERELAQLGQVLEECLVEPVARAVLVTSPPGVGKSRLRYEFVRAVQRREGQRVEVWIARGDPVGAGSPFGLIGQAIARAAGIRAGEPIEVRRRKLRARVARNVKAHDVARVAEFLAEIAGCPYHEGAPDSAPMSVQLRAARDDARLMGDQMRRAFEDFIAAECAAQPVMLVLEDLHWGDVPTVQLVDAALRHAAELPFFVLALGRPEVRELFPRLWDERGLVLILLRELKRSSAERLVREVLGDGADASLVAGLVERAAGNAFYLEELVRAVAAGKGAELPETVLAMVEVRLEALEPQARQVLRAASVFGQVFWSRGVGALLGGGERTNTVSEWLD
ncbi:MAG TPA: AAA family ATPase, partial [Minicystis sp.]|nr:AAA family ATPase [Minicystis sp.]